MPMPEILASLDDINANLPSDDNSPTVVADDDNTSLLQISVSRVIRGYLSRIIDNVTLASWTTPETTPELIKEVAGKLIAARLFFNETSKTSITIEDKHFSQKLYDEAIALLNQIILGDIIMPGIDASPTEGMSNLDFFPRNATDRAFTMGQTLY